MVLTRTANLLYDSALALLYPQECLVCGGPVQSRGDGIACGLCWAKVRFFTSDDTVCCKCGALTSGSWELNERQSVRCNRCEKYLFSAARACGGYEGALRASVLALKRTPNICNRLVQVCGQLQRQVPLATSTLIIPVPLHPERRRARGFNQSEVIAQKLSSLCSLPYDDSTLVRTRGSERHRAGMDAQGREETVTDAFEVRYPRKVAGETILLIDDVFTTGATASSCAGTLLSAGASEVFVLTLARPL